MYDSTARARTFVPSKDFEVSKRFYSTLGFDLILEDDSVAIFNTGQSTFLLQNYFQKEWAENFMMQLVVNDVAAWWDHIVELDLPRLFGVPAPKPPAVQSWGLTVAFVVDPSGVLWHVVQNSA